MAFAGACPNKISYQLQMPDFVDNLTLFYSAGLFRRNRTILTHDQKTMTKDAEMLVARGESMAGVIFVPDRMAIGRAINDLELILVCYSQADMRDRVERLPL